MKKLNIMGAVAAMVVFDYAAIGGPMRAFCAELTGRQWLRAHGFTGDTSIQVSEIVEWEISPTHRAADVLFRQGSVEAKFTDLIRRNLPVLTGGTAEAGDLMQFELDGISAFYDHSCSSWTGYGVTGSGSDGGNGFVLDPDFAQAWLERGKCRLRVHTLRLPQKSAA
ncbi:hypothetical protein [Azospirillum sp. sgz302134]